VCGGLLVLLTPTVSDGDDTGPRFCVPLSSMSPRFRGDMTRKHFTKLVFYSFNFVLKKIRLVVRDNYLFSRIKKIFEKTGETPSVTPGFRTG
jgi:hypothetical protein